MKRKNHKKNNLFSGFLILLLAITVGYAILSTQLKANGNINVKGNTWDVHFENVNIKSGSVTATTAPTSNNISTTEIPYTIVFDEPGDFYEFTVDVVNKGTVDAMIDVVVNKVYDADGETEITLPKYLKSSTNYLDGSEIKKNDALVAGDRETIKVRIDYRQDINISDLPSTGNVIVKFKLNITYIQADPNIVERTPKIASCPGCVYFYTLDDYHYGENGTILSTNQYSKNYRTVIEKTGKKHFLGAILNKNNSRIDRAFICKIIGNTPYCLESALNDDYGGSQTTRAQTYNSNRETLSNIDEYNCYEDIYDNSSKYTCYNGENKTANIDTYGNVEVDDEERNDYCYINEYSQIYCYEGEE